jgi:hypothetical protein
VSPLRIAALGAACFALTMSGCAFGGGSASERTPEAYCRAFYTKAAPIRQKYLEADANMNKDPLSAMVALLSSPGDLESIFGGMVDHAPDDIKADTEQVRDSFKKAQDSMADAISSPLKALGAGLVNSLTSAGAFQRVGDYLDAHCPVDSPLAQKIINGTG